MCRAVVLWNQLKIKMCRAAFLWNQLKPAETYRNSAKPSEPAKITQNLLSAAIPYYPAAAPSYYPAAAQQNIRKHLTIEPKNHAQINYKSAANHCKSKSCFSMLFGTMISFACFFKSRPDRPERFQNAWSYKVILRFSTILQPKREPQLSHNSATTQLSCKTCFRALELHISRSELYPTTHHNSEPPNLQKTL